MSDYMEIELCFDYQASSPLKAEGPESMVKNYHFNRMSKTL